MSDFTELDAQLAYEIAFALRNDMPVKSIAGRVRRICVEWIGRTARDGDEFNGRVLVSKDEIAALVMAARGGS